MPPVRQRTFGLIPTTLTNAGAKPPMTSKAAKKAYAKSKQGPRVSRAEQRRLDALELERQKKEFEREKAAKKAKAARDRKAEKEEKARQERKRAGLPEPSKFVRASQPTISRFVLGERGKRKWRDVDEDSDGTIIADAEDDVENIRPKRIAFSREEDTTAISTKEIGNFEGRNGPNQLHDLPNLPHPELATDNVGSDDEFREFPNLFQSALLDNNNQNLGGKTEKETSDCQSPILSHGSTTEQELPPPNACLDEDWIFDDTNHLSDMANAQLLSEEAGATMHSVSAAQMGRTSKVVSFVMSPLRMATGFQSSPPASPDDLNVVETPIFRNSRPYVSSTTSVHRRVSHPSSPSPRVYVPVSTQAFLEDNFDDFHPSPSQELRELLDEGGFDSFPSNTQIARELIPVNLPINKVSRPENPDQEYGDLFSTQDFVLSTQDLQEISPVKPTTEQIRTRVTEDAVARKGNSQVKTKPALETSNNLEKSRLRPRTRSIIAAQCENANTPSNKPSQSLNRMVSETLKDVNKSPIQSTISETRNNLNSEIRILLQRNFLEQETPPTPKLPEQRPHHSPKDQGLQAKSSWNNSLGKSSGCIQLDNIKSQPHQQFDAGRSSQLPKSQRKLRSSPDERQQSSRPASNTGALPRQRFFEEKENDLFKAALHESKVMSEQHNQVSSSRPPSRRSERGAKSSFNDKSRQPKMTSSKVEPPGDISIGDFERTRTLQRVQSTVTDYGDDDLSIEDLIGLC